MAEHQEVLQPLFPTHAAKGQQRPKGLSSTGACEDEDVLFTGRFTIQTTTQQLDQMGLPLPWLDRGPGSRRLNVKADRSDGVRGKDESF